MRRCVLCLLVLLLQRGAQPQEAANDPLEQLAASWATRFYGLVREDRKLGYGAFITRLTKDTVELEDHIRGVFGGPERRMRILTRCSRDSQLTPLSIAIETPEGSTTLTFKNGRATVQDRVIEIDADTVTLYTLARRVCLLPRKEGFQLPLKYLNLETFEVSTTKITYEGLRNLPTGKMKYAAHLYRVHNKAPIELWVDNGTLLALESPGLGGAVAYANPTQAAEGYDPDILVCESNLATLGRLQNEVPARFGGEAKMFCHETGRRFWLALSQTTPPLVPETEWRLFICPSTGTKPQRGICSYRGPKVDVNDLGPEAIVGADDAFNHRDGIHVVTRSGRVRWVKRGTEEFQRFLEITTD